MGFIRPKGYRQKSDYKKIADANTEDAATKGSGLRPSERTPTEPYKASPREKTKSVLRQMATEKATPNKINKVGPPMKKKKGTGVCWWNSINHKHLRFFCCG